MREKEGRKTGDGGRRRSGGDGCVLREGRTVGGRNEGTERKEREEEKTRASRRPRRLLNKQYLH